jgi:LCP family protein required for cell wall assembly
VPGVVRVSKPEGVVGRSRRWIVVVGLVVVLLVAGGFTTYYWAKDKLNDQIETYDAFEEIVGNRPYEKQVTLEGGERPLNVLVIGTDTREGQDFVKSSTPGLSDTTILLHVSADRSRGAAVSIPRDLIVDRPQCRDKDDPDVVLPAAQDQMWNAAYALGGVACTVAQFESMTDIYLNHYVVVDFNSVKDVADALDGVPVCMPYEVDDPANQVYLPEGSYDAKGNIAVSYVRARLNVGDGGDLGRLKRQQAFLAAMFKKANSTGTTANPIRLYNFLNAATQSVLTDPDLGTLKNLMGLGETVDRIGLENFAFLTMPVQAYAPDPNRLASAPEARDLWRQILRDEEIDESLLEEATTAAEGEQSSGREKGDDDIPSDEGERPAERDSNQDDGRDADQDAATDDDEQARSTGLTPLRPVSFTTPLTSDEVDPERYGLCG